MRYFTWRGSLPIEYVVSVVSSTMLMAGLSAMSKGHGRVERAILEALKWDKRRDNRGMLGYGADCHRASAPPWL